MRQRDRPAPTGKAERKSISRSGPVHDVAVGGGGRYLILHVPSKRKLAVFDAEEARVVKELPTPEEHVRFAAGMESLLVVLPGQNLLQRWSLKTLERETMARLPPGMAVTDVSMGSASDGPLFVARGRNSSGEPCCFMDVNTLKPVVFKQQKNQFRRGANYLRASADGRVFAMREYEGSEPPTLTLYILEEDQPLTRRGGVGSSIVVPSQEGRFLYTGRGVHDNDLKLLHPNLPPFGAVYRPFVPAHGGGLFLRLDYDAAALSFFLEGKNEPFARLPGVGGLKSERIFFGKNEDILCHDQRVHFVLSANLTIVVGKSVLELIPFDVGQALAKSGKDYLLVTSWPVRSARKGEAYRYQVKTLANKEVKHRLEVGPEGMRLSDRGELMWKVPKDFAESESSVILRVESANGQECFQTFKIRVR